MRIAVQSALVAAIIVVGTVNHDADAALHDYSSVPAPVFSPVSLTAFDPYPSVAAAMLPPPAVAPSIGPYVIIPETTVSLFAPERSLFTLAPTDTPIDRGSAPAKVDAAPVAPQSGPETAKDARPQPALAVPVEPLPQVLPRKNLLRRREVTKAPVQRRVARIAFDAPTLAPLAHTRFCKNYASDCRVQKIRFRGGAIDLTAERRQELVGVNAEVNRAIRPVHVDETPVNEKWLISPPEGDCNDYAVTKRHKLLTEGWPARNLLLAEVVTDWGEHHLVLVVRAREGDLVADNLSATIRSFDKAPYQWVRVQSPQNPKFWSTIKPPQTDMMAMAGSDRQL